MSSKALLSLPKRHPRSSLAWRHQKEIASFIPAQMQGHYWEDEEIVYEVKISKGFTELKPSAYTTSTSEDPLDFRISPQGKGNMAKYLFGGFKKCLYPVQKFDAEGALGRNVFPSMEGREDEEGCSSS